ncbi:MAG: hypothetical protein F4181_05110 [Proteobacteria bacterium]|nr:hypothetical protein [Pseudomonadota bacterium]
MTDGRARLWERSVEKEAEMARAMVRLAGSATVLGDSSKFGKLTPFAVAGFDSIDCVVREEAPDG